MIRALLRMKGRIVRNKVFSYRFHSRLKGAVIGLFLLTYLLGGYGLLKEGFSFIQSFTFVGDLLLDRVLELFFFALFVMLLISQSLFAYGAYFRSREVSLLKTFPIPSSVLFAWEYAESSVMSSWTFLFVSIPMLIAYAQVRHIFFFFLGLFFLLFLPLAVISGVLGTAAAFLAVRVLRSRWRWAWVALAAAGLLGALLIAAGLGSQAVLEPTMNQILDKMLRHTRFAHWPWWPSEWVSRSILAFLKGDIKEGIGFLWCLWISAAFLMQGLLLGGGWLWDRSSRWVSGQRARAVRRPERWNYLRYILKPFLGREGAGTVIKDIKTFVRDPGQWSHFAIFFGLLGIYFLNLRTFRYEAMGMYWNVLVTFLNLATVGLVAGTLSTRFFFPLPSLEIRRRWVWALGGAGKILWPKFAVGFLFLLTVTEILMIVSCKMLGLAGWMTRVCLTADFFISLTMMALALGLGAAFPVPHEDVSAKIVSGFGGTLCLVLTLGYLALIVLSLAIPIQLFVVHKAISGPVFARIMALVGILIVPGSLGLSALSMFCGNRAMGISER